MKDDFKFWVRIIKVIKFLSDGGTLWDMGLKSLDQLFSFRKIAFEVHFRYVGIEHKYPFEYWSLG